MHLNKMKKRGISPVIATVLLIAMVVVIALIIFIWFRGMVGEGAEKFGKNVELVCEDVEFEAEYSSGNLNLVNIANVPIFQVNIKIEGEGRYETKTIDDQTAGWDLGLAQGGTFSGDISSIVGDLDDKITVFPILLAEGKDGRKTYICGGQYGEVAYP